LHAKTNKTEIEKSPKGRRLFHIVFISIKKIVTLQYSEMLKIHQGFKTNIKEVGKLF